MWVKSWSENPPRTGNCFETEFRDTPLPNGRASDSRAAPTTRHAHGILLPTNSTQTNSKCRQRPPVNNSVLSAMCEPGELPTHSPSQRNRQDTWQLLHKLWQQIIRRAQRNSQRNATCDDTEFARSTDGTLQAITNLLCTCTHAHCDLYTRHLSSCMAWEGSGGQLWWAPLYTAQS